MCGCEKTKMSNCSGNPNCSCESKDPEDYANFMASLTSANQKMSNATGDPVPTASANTNATTTTKAEEPKWWQKALAYAPMAAETGGKVFNAIKGTGAASVAAEEARKKEEESTKMFYWIGAGILVVVLGIVVYVSVKKK